MSNYISDFQAEGEFLSWENPDQLKYFNLAVETGVLKIKLAKELRTSLGLRVRPGDRLWVAGLQKLNPKTQASKLKACRVKLVEVGSPTLLGKSANDRKAKILVCQKSGCLKRGGQGLCRALESELSDRGLQERVTIERTGCLKRCSSGPNLVVMPGKQHYSRIRPDAIARFLGNCI